jgi:transposase-like protein
MKNRPPAIIALVCAFGIITSAYAQTYNTYYGDNHTHTWYSDGSLDQNQSTYTLPVARSITWARTNRSSFDFLGISDHNHNEGPNMTLAYWRSGFREADSVNQDGNFVGLFGQEWGTISTGGHVLVYGTDKLFGWNPGVYDVYIAKGDYGGLFTAVKANNGYCYLAHPNSSDYDGIFTGAYNANWDSVVEGVSIKSGNAMSTNITETDPDAGDYQTQYHQLLYKGYHVAPIANQDNHYTTFGKSNQQRTALLATSLTKANVDDAFRKRRVYAVEDHNLQVQFEVGTHRMGEIFSMYGSIPIRVKAIDPDGGESISRIEIRYGVPGSGSAPTTLQYVTGRDSLVFTQAQTIGTTYYYYAYVVEADGHRAWTAPMWITISSSPPPGLFALLTPANASTGQPVAGTLRWQTSSGATSYDVYLGATNPPTTKVSSAQADTFYNYGGLNNNTIYYWKVTAKNAGGSADATASPWNFTTIQAPPVAFNLLSPANSAINQNVSGTLSWQTSMNATGYDVYLGTANPPVTKVSSNQSAASYNYSGLTNSNTYYWKVVAKNAIDSMTAAGSPWSFTTIIAPPGSFSLLSPANSAANQLVDGTLSWQTSANASGYDVYLSTINPPTIKVSSNQAGITYNYAGLTNSATYYWKIVAKNIADSTVGIDSPRSFTTIQAPPGSFNLLSPANGAINRSISGTLTWQASPSATQYDVYLDLNNPPLTRISSNQSGTTLDFSNLSYAATYYWKVIAKNNVDSITANGSPWNFVTIGPPPDVFQLSSPADNATGQLLAGSLVWNVSANALDYDIYLDTQNPPITKVDSNKTDTSYYYSGVSANTIYYWKITAKNSNGTTTASNAPRKFTTLPLPAPPSGVSPSQITEGSLQINWVDNATDETGYRIYRSLSSDGPFVQVDGDLLPNTITFTDNGLQINQRYYYRIVPFNNIGEGEFASINLTTLATLAGTPTITNIFSQSLTVIIVPNLNPPATQFAIRAVTESASAFVQQDGTLGSIPIWRTYSEWGGINGMDVRGLTSCMYYTFSIKARNLDGVETIYGSGTGLQLSCNRITMSFVGGWNLISLPFQSIKIPKSVVFPTSISEVFAYEESYISHDSLSHGYGYWIKFGTDDSVDISGDSSYVDTISLRIGWNLIGSLTMPISVNSIVTDPPGILTSDYFGFNGTYVRSDTLFPSKGYWIKSNADGKLILSSSANLFKNATGKLLNTIRGSIDSFMFDDQTGHKQTLYLGTDSIYNIKSELPPVPPPGAFDVRFKSNQSVEHLATNGNKQEFQILLQSLYYPVKVSWKLSSTENYLLKLSDGEKLLGASGDLMIEKEITNLSLVAENNNETSIPQEFLLFQNYPNPFNPSTVINYELPYTSYTRLTVYDLLGRIVATVVDAVMEKGDHAVTWNPKMAGGILIFPLIFGQREKPVY